MDKEKAGLISKEVSEKLETIGNTQVIRKLEDLGYSLEDIASFVVTNPDKKRTLSRVFLSIKFDEKHHGRYHLISINNKRLVFLINNPETNKPIKNTSPLNMEHDSFLAYEIERAD